MEVINMSVYDASEYVEKLVTDTLDLGYSRGFISRNLIIDTGRSFELSRTCVDGIANTIKGVKADAKYVLLTEDGEYYKGALHTALSDTYNMLLDVIKNPDYAWMSGKLIGELGYFAAAAKMPERVIPCSDKLVRRICYDRRKYAESLGLYCPDKQYPRSAKTSNAVLGHVEEYMMGAEIDLRRYADGNGHPGYPDLLTHSFQAGCEYFLSLLMSIPELTE